MNMKKIVLLFMIIAGSATFVSAQDTCVYFLRPNEPVKKEITLKSTNDLFEFNLEVGVTWLQVENKIHLIFDRKSVRGNEMLQLLFSMSKRNEAVASIIDCKSRKKPLWSKLKSEDSKYVQYFLKSDSIVIDDYRDCFKMLANNNEEEFIFELKGTGDFIISLPGFLVVKTEKRPWYSFSKRDKRVQFKTRPFDLVIQFERKPVIDTCAIAEKVVAFIEAKKKIFEEDSKDLLEAQKDKNCILFNLIKDKIRREFVANNDRCEKYAVCNDVAVAIKSYNDAFEKIFKEECTAAPARTTSNCTLSESELSSINNRLKNLQMKINVKKRNSESADDELKEYRAIKTAINARLTQECRSRYKQAVDAYISYCTNIESLF